MRSNQTTINKPLQLNVQLSDTYAVLTFPEREQSKYHDEPSNKSENLTQIQKSIHSNLTDEHFIHPFDDHGEKSELRHQTYESFESAFASMSHYGFASHRAVLLRPDDFHLLILQGFARFLQQYPEHFRESVVNFTGKMEVTINGVDTTRMEDWDYLPRGFAGLIKSYLSHPELADYLLQSYSDSTPSDATAKAITLMGTFSAYFSYAATTMCYIPKFVLQGTVEDWDKLANLPKQILASLHLTNEQQMNCEGVKLLERWLTRLQPVLDKMQSARRGESDPAFWDSFYKFHSHSGSSKISGNFIYFYPFLKTVKSAIRNNWGEIIGSRDHNENLITNEFILGDVVTLGKTDYHEGPTSTELPANIAGVDFKLKDTDEKDNEVIYDMGMKAGIVTFKESVLENPRGSVLRTHVDHSIFFKDKLLPAYKRPGQPKEKMQIDAPVTQGAANNNQSGNAVAAPSVLYGYGEYINVAPSAPPYEASVVSPVPDHGNTGSVPAVPSHPNKLFTKKKITFELEVDDAKEEQQKELNMR